MSLMLFVALVSCNNGTQQEQKEKTDTIDSKPKAIPPPVNDRVPATPEIVTYENARFRGVAVEKLDSNRFQVTGEAQIFEASFGWVIEDGHNELQKGFTTADKGAPEWGSFKFITGAKKQNDHSTLHLILFETSMKDGSRQHELVIPLR